MSKRARAAALKREAERLFPPGFWDAPPKTAEQIAKEKAASLRRSAADLRRFADGGMRPKKFRKEAERMEREAAAIEAAGAEPTENQP